MSGFGPRLPLAKSEHDLLRRFAVALIGAMQHARVQRVVAVSTASLFKDSIIPPTALAGRLFFPDVVVDATGIEEIFRKSGLAWTIVRPPRPTAKPRNGKYRARKGYLPQFGFTISCADFMPQAVETNASIGTVVWVSN